MGGRSKGHRDVRLKFRIKGGLGIRATKVQRHSKGLGGKQEWVHAMVNQVA